jgi:signal peptidase I
VSDSTESADSADRVDPAADEPQARPPKKKRPFWVELPILIVIAFGLTFLIQTFIAKVYYVPSGSMEQTLHGASSGGDRILANKIVYDFGDPQPGDVVVFSGPPSWAPEARIPGPSNWFGQVMQSLGSVIGIAPPNEKDYVKRVIATGGQTVQCCDAQGNVTVDGHSLDEPYIYEPIEFIPGQLDCTTTQMSRRCFGPVTVPAGELWVMGDHRSDSADSSYQCQGLPAGSGAQCQGPIPVDNVIGKAVFIVMPPSRWGTISAPDLDAGW